MNRQRILQLAIVLMLVTSFSAGCGAPVAQLTPPPTTVFGVLPTPMDLPFAVLTPTPQPTRPAPPTYSNLNSVWGSSGHDVFTVGDRGTILHYDGRAWSTMNSGTSGFLTAVWGSSDRDIFAVGWSGTILHYDGRAWTRMNSATGTRLWGVWGNSADDVFALGDSGTILHYDGKTWSPMNSGASNALYMAWGSSGRDVFAVGESGTILHYDGNAWSPMDSGTPYDLWGAWGFSGSDAFAIGLSGTILHYDGKTWAPMNTGTGRELYSMWGKSSSDLFVVGEMGTILHYDGKVWSPMNSGTTVKEIPGVWGSSSRDVFAVGYFGTILHYDGSTWSYTPTAIPPTSTPTPGPIDEETIRVGNLDRTYLYYVPANLPRNAPLLFAFHGSTFDGEGMRAYTGYEFESLADQYGFIVVYPNGYQDSWNDCRKTSTLPAKVQNMDDVGFVRALIARFQTDYGINTSRVFAMGYSNGGYMAYRLALQLPDEIAAIAAVASSLPTEDSSDCRVAGRPIPVLIMNGTDDFLNPYNGGPGKFGAVRSLQASAEYFAKLNGQTGSPKTTRLPHQNPSDPTFVDRTIWNDVGKPEVVLITIDGGGHVVPQSKYAWPSDYGQVTGDLEGPVEIWDFFSRQRSLK